jgi:hypothetical protein
MDYKGAVMVKKDEKIDWLELWIASKLLLVPEARTPLRIFRAWVETCAWYLIYKDTKHPLLAKVFCWLEFNVTRNWKFKRAKKRGKK